MGSYSYFHLRAVSELAQLAVSELALLGVSGVVAIDASQGVDKDKAWTRRASIRRDASWSRSRQDNDSGCAGLQ